MLSFSGKCTLPGKEEMLANIKCKHEAMGKQYVESRRHKLQVKEIISAILMVSDLERFETKFL